MADFEFGNMSNRCKFCRLSGYSGQSRHQQAASQHQLHSRHTMAHLNKGPEMQQVGSGRFATMQSSPGRFAGKSSPTRHPFPQKTSSGTPQCGYMGRFSTRAPPTSHSSTMSYSTAGGRFSTKVSSKDSAKSSTSDSRQ